MDNGSPWGDCGEQSWTIVTSWLVRLGIRVSHIRPHHPQTQGKDERFHRTLKAEVMRDRSHLDPFWRVSETLIPGERSTIESVRTNR